MPQDGARDLFLELNRQFNADIQTLAASARTGGGPTADLLARVRDAATRAHATLQGLQSGDPVLTANTAKVLTHLTLFQTAVDAAGAAPLLTQQLMEHLLEEQLEITAAVAASATFAPGAGAAQAAAPDAAPAAPGAATPADALGGGRIPLTVGSLIAR